MTITSVVTVDITQAMRDDLNDARENAEAAWQEAGRLKAALEMVEWIFMDDGRITCPWCYWSYERTDRAGAFHDPFCPRQLALYPPEPEEPAG
jgi:hypothetical protein